MLGWGSTGKGTSGGIAAMVKGGEPFVGTFPVTVTSIEAHTNDPAGTPLAVVTGPNEKVVTTTSSQIVPGGVGLVLGSALGTARFPEPGSFYARVKVVA